MASKGESGFFDDWPSWAKPTLALAAMILLGGAWIGVPLLAAWHLVDHGVGAGSVVNYQPMIVVLVAMTTATITGIFLFMTLRIDRGTRLKAEKVAEEAMQDEVAKAKKLLEEIRRQAEDLLGKTKKDAECILRKIEKDAVDSLSKIENSVEKIRIRAEETVQNFLREKFDEGTVPENIRKEIAARLTEEVLRGHVEAVLMVDANVQIVGEYAKRRAGDLDPAAIERLVGLMDETVEAWRGLVKAERRRRRKGFLRGLFSRFDRSSKDE